MTKYLVYAALSSLSFTVSAESLSNNQTLYNLSAASGEILEYTLNVSSGASDLEITIANGSGDADLYVRAGSAPSNSSYDCRPYLWGNDEQCYFPSPSASTYYIQLRAYSSFTGLTLRTSYSEANIDDSTDTQTGAATWSGFADYYQDAIGLAGSALREALHEAAARNQDPMNYSQVWDALKYTDEDPNNSDNVILLYSGRSQAKTFNASGNNNQDAWNREHSWPKSHGFPSASDWAYTDIHHLRPTDVSVNAARGSKDFDNGGSAISEASGNFTDDDSFEPRDIVKGDVARMMFYMDVRYNGSDGTGVDDLTLVNYSGSAGANLGKTCTLLSWHMQDPVDDAEIERHSRVVEWQGNRNPFIDYPTWAEEIWGAQCD